MAETLFVLSGVYEIYQNSHFSFSWSENNRWSPVWWFGSETKNSKSVFFGVTHIWRAGNTETSERMKTGTERQNRKKQLYSLHFIEAIIQSSKVMLSSIVRHSCFLFLVAFMFPVATHIQPGSSLPEVDIAYCGLQSPDSLLRTAKYLQQSCSPRN